MEKETFLEYHKKNLEFTGFWQEHYKSSVIQNIENTFHINVIREYFICDLVMNGDKVLVQWKKRHRPLNAEELEKNYGRTT